MNTNETYVSLETAELLKQAGFDWGVQSFYIPEVSHKLQFIECGCCYYDNCNRKHGIYSAPTLSIVQRWLREIYSINIDMKSIVVGRFGFEVHFISLAVAQMHNLNFNWIALSSCIFNTYEEALEAGIVECLKFIKNENETSKKTSQGSQEICISSVR